MHVRRRAAAPQAAHDGVTPTDPSGAGRAQGRNTNAIRGGRTDGRMAEWTETDGPGIWLESYAITYTRFISGIVSLCHANFTLHFIVNWTLCGVHPTIITIRKGLFSLSTLSAKAILLYQFTKEKARNGAAASQRRRETKKI